MNPLLLDTGVLGGFRETAEGGPAGKRSMLSGLRSIFCLSPRAPWCILGKARRAGHRGDHPGEPHSATIEDAEPTHEARNP